MNESLQDYLEQYREPRPGTKSGASASQGEKPDAVIALVAVESKLLAAYGYDPETQTLRVRFLKNEQMGEYLEVPLEKFEAMQRCASKGSFLLKVIVPNFKYRRLRSEGA